jgi:hypothetical protein
VIEKFRRWKYKRLEARVSTSENFAEFERLFSGPLTPDLASKMPLEVLLERRSGQVGQETRSIIDSEITRRLNSRLPTIAIGLSVIAIIIALANFLKS